MTRHDCWLRSGNDCPAQKRVFYRICPPLATPTWAHMPKNIGIGAWETVSRSTLRADWGCCISHESGTLSPQEAQGDVQGQMSREPSADEQQSEEKAKQTRGHSQRDGEGPQEAAPAQIPARGREPIHREEAISAGSPEGPVLAPTTLALSNRRRRAHPPSVCFGHRTGAAAGRLGLPQ